MTTSYKPHDWSVERDERGHYHLIFQGQERVARMFVFPDGNRTLRTHPPHLLPIEAVALLLHAAGAHEDAATRALDEIARLCGCERWEYPGQVVRDVRTQLEKREQQS